LIRAESAEYGYHGDPALEYTDTSDSGGRGVVSEVSAAEREAEIKCVATISEVYEEVPDESLPWEIKHKAEADAATDLDYVGAVDSWSQCMAREGYEYAQPNEPRSDPRWTPQDCGDGGGRPECPSGVEIEQTRPELTDVEIATAQADVACKAEVNLVPIYRAALWASQEARIAANLPALEKRLEQEKAKLDRAQAIIAEHG
jgi:hypothetical protein